MKKSQIYNNISRFSNCYGCGVCAKVCPVKIIELKKNEDGFFMPNIDNQNECINCGLCLKVCSFNSSVVSDAKGKIDLFAGWSDDAIIRQKCSSGGIALELAKFLLEKGYKACGVRYNVEKERAEHFVAEKLDDYLPSIGSKYIQSYTVEGFEQINKNDKYLVVGTPCQIDSIRRYIRNFRIEKNFVLMDFFCHGVPSYLLWEKYINEVKEKIGAIIFVSWRNKTSGWHDSWSINIDPQTDKIDWHESYSLKIKEKKHFYQSRWTEGDLFYKFFLGNYCLNKCCYSSCKYKGLSSAADIRIGDLWGKSYANNQDGVNGIITFSELGKEIINNLNTCTIQSSKKEIILESQMLKSPMIPMIRKRLLKMLKNNVSLSKIDKTLIKAYRIYCLPKRFINLICYKLNKRPLLH